MAVMSNTDGRRKRVLVVNDTQEILELFEAVLRDEMGLETILLSYAPDELTRIVEAAPDLVIVDFVIGGRELDGWQLLQKLRLRRETESIPVIACTGATQFVREAEGWLTEQKVAVLLKPFTVSQLEEAVRRSLRMGERTRPETAS
jgi:DNA-binding NtrC family response regulator